MLSYNLPQMLVSSLAITARNAAGA